MSVPTDDEADALVRQMHRAVRNIKIVDEMIDILEVGDDFHGDAVTRNGELTVDTDLSINSKQSKISSIFTIVRARGWIRKLRPTTSLNPRRKGSGSAIHEVTPDGRAAGPVLRAAMERYRKELSR
jgi:hypothetical protein